MGRQAEMSAESRARLIEAARELFAEHGARATSVQAIAEKAGISRGSIAWHFGSKEGLVVAVVDAEFERVATRVRAALDAPGPAGWTRLLQVQRAATSARDSDVFVTLGLEAIVERGALMTAIAAGQQRIREVYADYVRRSDLLPADVDPLPVATALRALGLGLNIQRRFDDSVLDLPEALAAFRTLLAAVPPEDLDRI